MANNISISFKGSRERVDRMRDLAISKNMNLGELVADAVEKVYGDELKIVEESFRAMSDRLNGHTSKRTHEQS